MRKSVSSLRTLGNTGVWPEVLLLAGQSYGDDQKCKPCGKEREFKRPYELIQKWTDPGSDQKMLSISAFVFHGVCEALLLLLLLLGARRA